MMKDGLFLIRAMYMYMQKHVSEYYDQKYLIKLKDLDWMDFNFNNSYIY